MKIAMYKDTTSPFDYTTIVKESNLDLKGEYAPGYLRISEWIDVTFPPLSKEVVVQEHLRVLDTVEAELRNKFQEKLNQIEGERAKLLSLSHEVSA
ncbi:MAG TPA: hypothetical protein VK626_01700 [Nitrospiraceae bacterium]|nr:hypothetical protein [Nitrospiraceae bacterium]